MVSVIIPTFNRAYVLRRAVESVLSQSYREYEIIIVDDGSTDDTARVLGHFKKRVRAFYSPHSGVSKARNTGIEKAEGEWISFLDSDDYWFSEKLEKQMSYLKNNPQYRVCHTDEIWIKNGKRINQGKKHKKNEGWFFSPSLRLCLISPSTVVIHREVFDKIGKFDENFEFVEDYELWLRITSQYPIGFIREKLVVKTGGHPDQLSRRINGIEKYRIDALEKLILKGNLKLEYLNESIEMYKKKCAIYISGCIKRGKQEEIDRIKERTRVLLSRVNGFVCYV